MCERQSACLAIRFRRVQGENRGASLFWLLTSGSSQVRVLLGSKPFMMCVLITIVNARIQSCSDSAAAELYRNLDCQAHKIRSGFGCRSQDFLQRPKAGNLENADVKATRDRAGAISWYEVEHSLCLLHGRTRRNTDLYSRRLWSINQIKDRARWRQVCHHIGQLHAHTRSIV